MQTSVPPYEIWFPNLGIGFKSVPRSLFSVFGMDIYLYAVCIVTGIIAALFLAQWYAKKTGQKKDDYLDLLTLGLVTSFIGLRLFYVAFSWGQYKDNLLDIFNFRKGGLAIYGGIFGAFLAGFIISKVKKIPFSTLCDTCAPSLLLGQVIGRWGNFFNREAFGDYSGGLLAMQLKQSEVAADSVTAKMLEHLAEVDGATYIQVHTTFLYEMLWNVAVLLLMLFFTKRKKVDGEILLLYLFGYGLGRVWIEGLRTDQLLLWGTNLPVSQLLSVAMMAVAVVLFLTRRLAARRKSASDELAER